MTKDSRVDPDVIILTYQQSRVESIKQGVADFSARSTEALKNLDGLEADVARVRELLEKTDVLDRVSGGRIPGCMSTPACTEGTRSSDKAPVTYEALYDLASKDLTDKGVDLHALRIEDLVKPEIVEAIDRELNRPLEREVWTSDDKVAVFIAAIVGAAADLFFGNRKNRLTGQDSPFAKWLQQFHVHPKNSPIDFNDWIPEESGQEPKGLHRARSTGHDLVRFAQAIWQIKNGQFVGVKYENKVAQAVVSSVNQYGVPYDQLSWAEAVLNYLKHMAGDFCSKMSLPVPGMTFLTECSSHEVRVMAVNMYKDGFNLRNVTVQSVSTMAIELILRIYNAAQTTKRLGAEGEPGVDYTGIDRPLISDLIRQAKFREMCLLAHTTVAALNLGRIALTKRLAEINVTEILATIHYLAAYVHDFIYRHSAIAKFERNNEDIVGSWNALLRGFESGSIALTLPDKPMVLGQ